MIAVSFRASDGGLLVAVAVLLFVAGILALAETSLVRTSKVRARALSEQGHHGARSLLRLVENPERFLSPILLLVLICQLVTATLVTIVAGHLFGGWGEIAGVVFEIVVIFVLAEAIPKDWAVRHPDRAALFSAPLVTAVIAFPPVRLVAGVLIGLARFVSREEGGHAAPEPDLTESELLAIVDVAVDEEVIAHEERAIISSIIEFGDTIVREVMAPRTDVVAIEKSMTAEDGLERALAAGLSRVPVFAANLDDIVGIAYTRDLMRAVRDGKGALASGALSREARYVPETKRVAPLLREMQRQQYHLAVVIDEYGGTAGIVTLEDLIEELVGEIADEYDDGPTVEALASGGFRLPGKMAIDEVNELLDVDLPVGDWDTIGGLLLHEKGVVPQEGESVEVAGYRLVAERVVRRRIDRVTITASEPVDAHPDAHGVRRQGE